MYDKQTFMSHAELVIRLSLNLRPTMTRDLCTDTYRACLDSLYSIFLLCGGQDKEEFRAIMKEVLDIIRARNTVAELLRD